MDCTLVVQLRGQFHAVGKLWEVLYRCKDYRLAVDIYLCCLFPPHTKPPIDTPRNAVLT